MVSSESTLPLKNDLFNGRYRPVRLLGVGGMGQVFLVEDMFLDGEKVALKVLKQELIEETTHKTRFLREVKLARQVTHRNVVRTYDVGSYKDSLYYTMEHVEGVSIKDMLESKGPFTEQCLISIIPQICEGLHAIHELEIVHRDLKPANIIVTDTGEVKIADFGIARPGSSELTHGDEIIGSSRYMAPEIWIGKPLSSATDIYALGVVVFEMCTGIAPFEADNPAELMWKHLDVAPVKPSEIEPSTPSWANALVLALMSKDDSHRPCNAMEIALFVRQACSEPDFLTTGEFLAPLNEQSSASVAQSAVYDASWIEEAPPSITAPDAELMVFDGDIEMPPVSSLFLAQKNHSVALSVDQFGSSPIRGFLQILRDAGTGMFVSIVGILLLIPFAPKLLRALAISVVQSTGNRVWLSMIMECGAILLVCASLALIRYSFSAGYRDFTRASREVFYSAAYLFFVLIVMWSFQDGASSFGAELLQQRAEELMALATLSGEHLFFESGNTLERLFFVLFTLMYAIWIGERMPFLAVKQVPPIAASIVRGVFLLLTLSALSALVNSMLGLEFNSADHVLIEVCGTYMKISRYALISGAVSWVALWLLSLTARFVLMLQNQAVHTLR